VLFLWELKYFLPTYGLFYYFFVLLFKLLNKKLMKKIILSLFFSATCLVGMSQKAQISLPITWDDTLNVDYTVIGFGNDTAYLAADPTNAANIALEVIKPVGAQTWAGVVLGNDSLSAAIPFSAGNTVIRARVYASVVGTPIRMKVENEANAGIYVEAEVNTTVAGWDTLSFDFASQVGGTPAINFANVYDKIAVFFNFGNSPTVSETYFIDYVTFSGGGSTGPSKAQIDLPINWDDTANVNYAVIDFGGNVSAVVVDPTNASNLVLQSDKPSTAQSWAGTSLGSFLATAINFSASSTVIQVRIWSAASGIPVLMKVEDQTNAAQVELDGIHYRLTSLIQVQITKRLIFQIHTIKLLCSLILMLYLLQQKHIIPTMFGLVALLQDLLKLKLTCQLIGMIQLTLVMQ
jgi:hypothetical protein